MEKSKYKRVKGKLFVYSKSMTDFGKSTNSMWQPDAIDIERVNNRLKQPI